MRQLCLLSVSSNEHQDVGEARDCNDQCGHDANECICQGTEWQSFRLPAAAPGVSQDMIYARVPQHDLSNDIAIVTAIRSRKLKVFLSATIAAMPAAYLLKTHHQTASV